MLWPYPYYLYERELPKNFCNAMLSMFKEHDAEKAGVYRENKTEIQTEVRNNSIKWINNSDIIEIMQLYVQKANEDAGWNFDITTYETPQLSCYAPEQFYDWHIDVGVELPEDTQFRKLSVSISLNEDYKGGDFEIEHWCAPDITNRKTNIKGMRETGSIVVFPSFLHHRVTPVTTGKRYSLVCWFRGPPFK
ncbi:MAG: PKHD-type hydroxylase YbiX [Chlamydiia bacterium]|nr:PKHD-type hydroxylase YbiX [Chlamydiia bacterium]